MDTAKSGTLMTTAVGVDWLRVISMVLSICGLLAAGYMTWAELTGNETVCAETAHIDCAAVQESAYAKTLGISVALIGTLGFMAILAVLVLEDQVKLLASYGRTLVVAMALFGVIFQTYLSYVEAEVLEKWCQWCITSHIIITLLLVIGLYRLYQFLKPLRR